MGFLLFFLACFHSILSYGEGEQTSVFYRMCGTTIHGENSMNVKVSTALGCPYFCVGLDSCEGVRYNSTEVNEKGSMECHVFRNVVVTSLDSNANDCMWLKQLVINSTFMETATDFIVVGTSTEYPTSDVTTELTRVTEVKTTVTSAVPVQGTILGVVEGFKQKCNSNSQYDIIILTLQGVYTYDNYASLSQGPCLPVESFTDVFVGFSNLPAVTDIDAIMSHQNDFVDLFANDQVWRWRTNTPAEAETGGFPASLETHLKATTVDSNYDLTSKLFTSAQWGVNREKFGSIQRFFYTNSNTFKYYHNTNPMYAEFTTSGGDILNEHGHNINIWSQLPADVADVCRDPDEWDNYIVFTNNGNHYQYTVGYNTDQHNPPVSLSAPKITVF